MEKSKKKALGSLKSIVEFYQGLYRDGTFEKGKYGLLSDAAIRKTRTQLWSW